MGIEIVIRALGIWFTFISLPALAIVGVYYYCKFRTTGGRLLGCGAMAAAAGSIFNKLFPWQSFLTETHPALPDWAHLLVSIALGVHILGLNVMVAGLIIIAFWKQNNNV